MKGKTNYGRFKIGKLEGVSLTWFPTKLQVGNEKICLHVNVCLLLFHITSKLGEYANN